MTSPTAAPEAPFFPAPRECPYDTPPSYTAFREAGGPHKVTIWDGSRHWLVTRYEDIRAVLASPSFSVDVRRPGFPLARPGQREQEAGLFVRLDGTEHTRMRQMLSREFGVRHTRAMHDDILRVADELIDDMLAKGGPADLIRDFALPLPSRVICLILGVPYEDHAVFYKHADTVVNLDVSHEEREKAIEEASAYYAELIERKRAEPGDDMISRLLADHTGPDGFAPDHLPVLVGVMVGSGFETTSSQLGLGALTMLLHPDQRQKLCEQPELAASTVEEMLRYWSITATDPRRVAVEDIEIGGQLIRAGEGVLLSLISGNRDPRAFGTADGECPADRLDITRGSRRHLAFGFGAHQCLGQNLARAELRIAWPRLFERIPDLRLAVPEGELVFKNNSTVYGLKSLPVTW
ncbi:cytochrome P450 [Streptomyces ipomoeae]|jgi:cytochrome P450|uniref:Unspecific monooxygenase n=2 Tax=Streptomyces ipomoeae TaxID=103232 RepID=L1L1W9_9ACTN|nr:cytochrome P450 [Streptomyces ipomoeae]EKX66882.1 unspecific monooxygenase [Streptomyces ipomoeae 91-03]MDX2693196.1 cytochrome P450 [Streptomyces ipomoeae]MDX2820639.1 cytochrome P450 [Streptomyces ipomoeae]MDX2838692.1 cytochrome P450 [Streptomyces ipomoeae]MDX2873147.1 cytochrome P450 [Streptomyces ipomoeae]